VKPPSVLLIDDEPLMRLSMLDALKAVGYDVHAAATGQEGLEKLDKETFEIVITDLRLPGSDGLALLQVCKQRSPRTEVIVITAHGSVETAVEAMRRGAYDYITKPFSMEELLLIVERVTKVVALRQENLLLREELEGKFSFEGILGKNDRMREVLEKIKLVSATDSTVLIVGESGTGKELVANAILVGTMRWSRSAVRPFRKRCWRRNSSAMKKEPLPGRSESGGVALSWPTEERCSWTKSGTSLRSSKSSCSGSCKNGDSNGSAGTKPSRRMSAWSAPRRRI